MKKIVALLVVLFLCGLVYSYEFIGITDYEFFAKDGDTQYLVDLYDDLDSAKIDEEKIKHTKTSH